VSRLRDLALGLSLTLAALPAAGEVAFVTCQNGDAVSVVDLDTGTERARWASSRAETSAWSSRSSRSDSSL